MTPVRLGGLLLALGLLVAEPAAAARTFYVDPANGNNNNNGENSATPWKNPPGTLTANASGFISAQWGANVTVTPTARIQCGDTILIRGGQTQAATQGGAWQFRADTGQFYVNCPPPNLPTTVRVATTAEWAASVGPFFLNATGVTLAQSPSFNYTGAVLISRLSGFTFGGASATQLLRIGNCQTAANVKTCIEMDGNITNITVQYVETFNSRDAGIAMGDITDALVKNSIFHDNGGPGINCGQQVHHNCLRVGWVDNEDYNNGLLDRPFYSDSLYIQGAQQLYVLRAYSHDNSTNGMNIGAGDHGYCWQAKTLIRDSVFSHNGQWNDPQNSKANYQGGGDTFPAGNSTTSGYCSGGANDGQVCTGSCSNNPACSAGNLTCSFFDAYSTFDRVVTHGAAGPGSYIHHGSGFSVHKNITSLFNATISANEYEDDRVAADHSLLNSILLGGLTHNSNSIHKVCRQNCQNPGIPCATDSECGACSTNSSPSIPACDQYLPMGAFHHNLIRPANGNNASTLTSFTFLCNSACGNSGTACDEDSDCTGCAGGCNWRNSGATFTQALAGAAPFLTGTGELIGSANDPGFTDITAAACTNGTDVRACNLTINASGPAVDAGTYFMLTNGGISGGTTFNVKKNPLISNRGSINFNGILDDPRTFFVYPNAYPTATGDTIQVKGATFADVTPKLGTTPGTYNAERAVIVSLTATSITVDRAITTVPDNAGVDRPWEGNAPDLGAVESGGTAATTTTTSSTTSTSTSVTTTTSTSTSTTATSSTVVTFVSTTTSTSVTSTTLVPPSTNTQTLQGGTLTGGTF